MRLASVVGTRPQLVKVAAMLPHLPDGHVLIDTGQHHDYDLAGTFYDELAIPTPDYRLGINGGLHGKQTARMLESLEGVLSDEMPDAVLLYGDTNSTLAGALAASKLGIPIAHIEAGLRSRDRRMPEEVNRVLTDHASTWCFAPNRDALANLLAEGITTAEETGDPMADLAAEHAGEVLASVPLGLAAGGYIFATVHRAENRTPAAIAAWTRILDDAAERMPVMLALHPGTRAALPDGWTTAATVIDPVGYRESLALQAHAFAVITDSGGVQRESSWFGVPCLVMRRTTEWGVGTLIGHSRSRAAEVLDGIRPAPRTLPPVTNAAARIVEAVTRGLRA